MTSLSVGSLLDDNIWHDVVISRNRKDIMFSVDRVLIRGRIKGEFYRLNLNRGVSILPLPSICLCINRLDRNRDVSIVLLPFKCV